MAYRTTIVEVGPEAATFLEENMAITFAGDAPEGLRPFCFLVEKAELEGNLEGGQPVLIGSQQWRITAIGEVAQQNLHNLGHVTLVFDGETEPRMPGAIHVGGVDEPPALGLGTEVVFGL